MVGFIHVFDRTATPLLKW